ncbi:MAG: sulfur oxidation c-type cytochrome SoxA [Hyphomicrobiaceae bacterium]|nr:sulfur oxidation c-type cytochrome SoxA [Hyphomicrobiaceae bacterium]
MTHGASSTSSARDWSNETGMGVRTEATTSRTAARLWRTVVASALVLAISRGLPEAADAPAATQAVARDLTSATEFLSRELRAEQGDDLRNRGMLWVEQGAGLWDSAPGPSNASCRSCHGDPRATMADVAARYPVYDRTRGRVLNLEGRVNACRTERQGSAAWAYETNELLAMTAYLSHVARGLPKQSPIADGSPKDTGGQSAEFTRAFERGRTLWTERQGQLNLSCAQCHDGNVGRKLRGDTISSAVPNGYPAYRLEWNGLGSLHRRLRACQLGVRAVQFEQGSDEYLALEVYLAWRARGLPLEAPAMRR